MLFVSYFNRLSLTDEELQSLQTCCTNFFRVHALYLAAKLTTWTIGHVVPAHARELHQSLGVGLGMNTMEGREAKHVVLAKFVHNTHVSDRWRQVFKHEFISLIWLPENGCDTRAYKYSGGDYIPKRCGTPEFCHCGEKKDVHKNKCNFCSDPMQAILAHSVKNRKIVDAARELWVEWQISL